MDSLTRPILVVLSSLSLTNPLNLALLLLALYLSLSLLPSQPLLPTSDTLPTTPSDEAYNWRPAAHPPAVLWRTWTPTELEGYDGTPSGKEGGRILFAIRRKVYDVSSGRNFYGPGGPYSIFAGRDASRGLAAQSFEEEMLSPLDGPIDPLLDLTKAEWANLQEWEGHFGSRYVVCGDYVERP